MAYECELTVDGAQPDNYGYTVYAHSLRNSIIKIWNQR